MKIAIIHLELKEELGEPRIVFSLAKTYQQMGHSVIVYTNEFDPTCFPNMHTGLDIRVVRLNTPLESVIGAKGFFPKVGERIRRNFLHIRVVKKIADILDEDLDAIHCLNDYSYQVGVRYKKVNPRAAVIWMLHNPTFVPLKQKDFLSNALSYGTAFWEKLKSKFYLKGVDLVAVLDEKRKKILKQYGIEAHIVPVPVDSEEFYFPVRRIKDRKIRLLSMGALFPARKFEDVILAGSILRQMGYDARVDLICRDAWNNSEYRAFLLKTANEAGMKRFVDFRFDRLANEEFFRIIKESDIYVFTNQLINWAMSPLEAMAAGKPVIVSRDAGLVEVVTDGVNGLAVDPGRPDQIAQKAKLLADNPKMYEKIALAGQEFVRTNLTWGKYAERYLDLILNRIMEERSSGF